MSSVQAAAQLLGQGRFGPAAALLEDLLTHQPDDALAWQLLGLTHLAAGAPDKAVGPLERSLALAEDARSLSLLGVARSQRGEHAAALALFDRAVALAPAQPQLWFDRAKALYLARQLEEALRSLERQY